MYQRMSSQLAYTIYRRVKVMTLRDVPGWKQAVSLTTLIHRPLPAEALGLHCPSGPRWTPTSSQLV